MRAHRPITTVLSLTVLAFLALLGTGTHTVRPGETLGAIARSHGTTVAALVRANHITDPDRIYVGQRLSIASSGSSGSPAATGGATRYTVRPGDTLGRVAARHGTTVARLVALNGIRNQNLVRVGQVLQVPAAGAAAVAVVAPAGGATTHLVRAGESVAGIAARYRIPQAQLVLANGLRNGRIYVGQQLRLVPPRGAGQVGAIACPVTGRVWFVNDWGFPRPGGRYHEGNDVFAARGRAVVAVVAGTAVQKVGTAGGNQVRLQGDDGVSYSFTHLDRFGASGRVRQGAVIGYVGTTGNAAGGTPHLHFEVHPGGGAAINPYPQLADAC